MRDALRDEMERFYELLDRHGSTDGEGEKEILAEIKGHLDSASGFTAFKRWAIRDNEGFGEAFGVC